MTRHERGRRHGAIDTGLVLGLAVVLVGLFLWPTLAHGHLFPVGPDVPVYLWWSRVAADAGVAPVGERPGTIALLPTISGALRVGLVPALAGVTYASGVAVGLAGAALVRGGGRLARPAWFAGGFLAGVWATHLAEGYTANLAMAAAFVAAAVALGRRTRRAAIAAAIVLGGGGLMHPQFAVVGGMVLVITALWAEIRDRRSDRHTGDAGRVVGALGGAAVVVVAGLLAATGPRITGDTSKDAFLRRVGWWAYLRETYVFRFEVGWPRYAPIMNTFLVLTGATLGRGFARRFLVSWMAFTIAAVAAGVATGGFPPDRVLTFAFCIPLLASMGLAWLGARLGRWWLAWPVGITLVVLTAAPTLRAWDDTRVFVSPGELRTATLAGRIAATLPEGTPLVFVVDDPETPALFLASHARNVARAALPPDRADDVYIVLGRGEDVLAGRVTQRGDPLYDLAARDSTTTVPRDPPPVVFVLEEFDTRPGALDLPGLTRWDPALASTASPARPLPAGDAELVPATPNQIAGATVRTLLLLTIVGLGWAWWAMGADAAALATAPAFGIATLGISALVLERLGAGLGAPGVSTAASALAGGAGYTLWLVRRRADRRRLGAGDLLVEGDDGPHT